MPVAQQIGRLGKLFVKRQADYITAATMAATNAFRHLDVGFSYNLNRQNSLEKKGTPGLMERFSRHVVAGLDLRAAYLSPSGTLGTAPEADLILESGFGSKATSAAATTVASATTSSSFTLTSAVGFSIGQLIAVRRAAYTRVEITRITNLAGAVVTCSPALGGTPAAADSVKGGVVYSMTNGVPEALTVCRYLPDVSYQLEGVVIDKLGITMNGNDETKMRASGPARLQTRPAQAEPGAFTTIGNPVTGILGAFLIGGVAFKITQVDIEINNAMELVNDSLGEQFAEDKYRNGRRDCTIAIEARLTDDETLYALAEAAGDGVISVHTGQTEGKVVAILLPRAEFDIPDVPDDDGAIRVSYRGVAKETVGNDEVFLGFF
jgi:hypothetical protein